jgi:hypothetical protein
MPAGLWVPSIPLLSWAPTYTSSLIDATGEKMAWLGRVWNRDHTSKNISRVGFRFGAVTKAGGSGLTVSLQNVDTANGPPYRPDETQDQTVAIANGDSGFTANAWYRTGTFSASRTVAFGELVAVVVEYDGSGRLSSDVVNFSNPAVGASNQLGQFAGAVAKQSGTWGAPTAAPNIILEFDDGTFGTFIGAVPGSALTVPSFNSGTTSGSGGDERALEFTVPFPLKVDSFWAVIGPNANADVDVVLYDGTTALATVSNDYNTHEAAAHRPAMAPFSAEQTLAPGHTYRLAVKPTTANSTSIAINSVNAVAHWDAVPGFSGMQYNFRTDGGAWGTATTTDRIFAGIGISAIDAGPRSRMILGI